MRENHWYNKAKIGMFLHWGIENGRTANEFEISAKNWSAKAWIETAKKLHADYVTLTTFHCSIGYLITWKSDIPGLNKTKRDFLGELIEEASKENIKVIVYITSSPTCMGRKGAEKCIDYEAYKNYRNIDFDEESHIDFQRFLCKDVVMEIMDKYADIRGFWFDGWNDKAVCEDMFRAVHEKNPDVINIRNNFYKEPYKDEDVMSQECLGKVYSPDYDLASGSWLESSVASEWCYVPFGI